MAGYWRLPQPGAVLLLRLCCTAPRMQKAHLAFEYPACCTLNLGCCLPQLMLSVPLMSSAVAAPLLCRHQLLLLLLQLQGTGVALLTCCDLQLRAELGLYLEQQQQRPPTPMLHCFVIVQRLQRCSGLSRVQHMKAL